MVDEKLYEVRIRPDTSIELVETVGGADEIHRLVGGFFENVYLPPAFPLNDVIMVVDEEGKLKHKPINILATVIQNSLFDFIVGDALLLKLVRVGELNELDEVPFPKEEAEMVKQVCEKILKKIPKDDLDVIINYVKNL